MLKGLESIKNQWTIRKMAYIVEEHQKQEASI